MEDRLLVSPTNASAAGGRAARLLGIAAALLATATCGGPLADGDDSADGAADGDADTDADGDADTDADSDGDADADTDEDADEDQPPQPALPARYPPDALRSPVTEYVAEMLRGIRATSDWPDDEVFMKVGASGTVSEHLLHCFAGEAPYVIDLAEWDGELWPTVEHFRRGDAAGTTPFDRRTLAAEVGRTAAWVLSGDPSPLDDEIDEISPRFALVNYGTNDMQMGVTHRSALFPFHESLAELLDGLVAEGIVPLVTGLNPRSDTITAARWVPTYDAVTRGMAEARQVPYIDLFLAARDLPDMGLVSDGIHGNVYSDGGSAQPCVMTAEGLEHNYNVRNLLTLEALDVLRRVVLDGEAAPDPSPPPLAGEGTEEDPYVIDALPFTHYADTGLSPSSLLDGYPGCDTGQDESGPEILYRLDLDREAPVRAIVLDLDEVDVDLHLLGTAPVSGEGCLERDDRIIERTLGAGGYHLSLDSYVPSDGIPREGEYLLVVLECEPDDPDCS